ncbi:glycosyltransferase [candidate division WS5 bacterium]|uniref:Glycosyltransferase n=1 Tax=candidate division WS5 bacterium TaxID=2093353 RepID=A0A419DEK1_9BACT|nr:MAG: glycosyltransferase [candidate division WS5 bacterium]
MKVFVIGARGFPHVQGGIEKYCEELYSRLAKKNNVDITGLVIPNYYKKNVENWEGIKFIYIRSLKSKNYEKILYGLLASLITIIKKPDIAHFHGLSCCLYIPLVKLFNIKVILTFQSRDYLYPKWGKIAKYVWRLSEKAALKSDQIIAVSHAHMEYIKNYTNKVVRIPNGVEINHLDISNNEEGYFLRKYGLEKQGYIFFAGRFTPEKAIEDLVTAYEQLGTDKWKLVLAGDADHEDSYSRKIKNRIQRIKNIILTGFITGKELQALFANAKLFVLPSKFEGLPHVLLEAVSFNIEVLASNIEANLQINLDKDSYFEQGNIEDLKQKVRFLLENETPNEVKLRRMEMIRKEYNWETISEKIYGLYETLCQDR